MRAEDIAKAFLQIDNDGNGKITAKDLKKFMQRRGTDISEEEASDMLALAETKTSNSKGGNKFRKDSRKFDYGEDEKDNLKVIESDGMDYQVFKKYMCNPSVDNKSSTINYKDSSLKFNEYT